MQLNPFFQKVFKFLIGGGITTCFNLLLIFLLVDWWGWNTPLLHNIANAISIELSVLLSFFIYRIWVWTDGEWNIKEVLFKQLPLFHLAAGSAVVVRIFFLFPLLDYLSIDFILNTLAGGLFGAGINYIMSDRLVFKSNNDQQTDLI
ncbi:MAG: GtrA family protein [Dolichospermum sp. DET50]|jgi:dolichol-phosphate mannosyltransferase|nr:GtrA family protein [Dolichospermum sp. DET66]MBS3035716.1 GtrA family protein [Dolichospermum sp. DET67]MBS3040918.1 GtrA family protein [Dolichospermum sp. DET50]QSX68027.1 MAG: GtrA family protein [Dolichospermum sp. DET69]